MKLDMVSKHNYLYREIKKLLRSRFFDVLQYLLTKEECKDILISIMHEQIGYLKHVELLEVLEIAPPYADLNSNRKLDKTCLRSDIVFVTGRFRSGSTLIWNLFRNIPGVTSYYEPFNERRWFDPVNRGLRVDSTHRKVKEYWREYDGLDKLSSYYDEAWTYSQLYMNARNWNPTMQRYIEILVESAKGRPVLQFNRVDIRLPWLRSRFPNAQILHIFRHPRDQWCSTLGNEVGKWKEIKLKDFEQFDGFYLLNWGRDLRRYFPFISMSETSHPYELFYQIWKLSYLFGRTYSNTSIALEEILKNPKMTIERTLKILSFDRYDLAKLVDLVTPVDIGKWERFADHQWFSTIEEDVDEKINQYFNSSFSFRR